MKSKQLEALPSLKGHHILVCGPTGSGKSHTLSYLIAQRKEVVVCDPHYLPGSWPRNCEIAGAGRDYTEIEKTLKDFEQEMDRRYKQRADGKETFPQETLVIDETPAICSEVKGASDILKKVAREGRKVGMFLMIGAQGMSVVDLDIRGSGNMRENFAIVKLPGVPPTMERRDTPRTAIVLIGEEEYQYIVPKDIPEVQMPIETPVMRSQKAVQQPKQGHWDDLLPFGKCGKCGNAAVRVGIVRPFWFWGLFIASVVVGISSLIFTLFGTFLTLAIGLGGVCEKH